MMKILAKFELLLIGLWLGAACFFSLAVAPSAFSILPSRELAGGMVNRTLTILNFSGLIISILLILSTFISRDETKKLWIWAQRIMLLIVAIACGAGQFIIGFYLEHLRGLIGRPIDEVAVDDPLRVQFNLWHQYSVWVLITGMVAALIAFFLMTRGKSSRAKTSGINEIPDFELPDELKM